MKKKAIVLAICMAVSAPAISLAKGVPSDIVGLNLGDIQSSSHLGQPFNGIIPILFASVEEVKQLKVNLAPESVFKKIGAEKLPFLNQLTFEVGIQKNKPVVFVRSAQPIDMPFMSFVLEVVSSQGVIYQDYTVLIDPPGYRPNSFKDTIASQIAVMTEVNILPKLTGTSQNYKVSAGDTLSKIAAALKTSQMSLKKMIDVIHETNPKAFVDNDINKLKSGVYLKIPSINKVKSFNFKALGNTSKKIEKEKEATLSNDAETAASYTVKKGDTLSGITQKFAQDEISFTKRMHAIFNANRHAFSNEKINVLKVGSTLSIPYVVTDIAQSNNVESTEVEIQKVDVVTTDDTSIGLAEADKPAETSTTTKVPNVLEFPVEDEVAETVKFNEGSAEKKVQAVDSTIINNLEKRVRELRNNLSESKKKLLYVEDVLLTKNIELKIRNKEINKFKNYIEQELGKEEIEVALQQESLIITDKMSVAVNKKDSEEKQKAMKLLDEAKASTLSTLEVNPISENATTPKSKSNNKFELMSTLESLSFSDISYSLLALLLALGLITYRKELKSYAIASGDYPTFYPAEGGAIELNITKVDEVTVGSSTTDKTEITDDIILDECDKLIDELSDNLRKNTETHDLSKKTDEEWDTLEKICDDYIEKHNEEETTDIQYDITLDTRIDENVSIDSLEPVHTFEDMVTDLIENLDDKSSFDETNPLYDFYQDQEKSEQKKTANKSGQLTSKEIIIS